VLSDASHVRDVRNQALLQLEPANFPNDDLAGQPFPRAAFGKRRQLRLSRMCCCARVKKEGPRVGRLEEENPCLCSFRSEFHYAKRRDLSFTVFFEVRGGT